MTYISDKDLSFFRALVMDKTVEVCGFLLTHKEQIRVNKETMGKFIPNKDVNMLKPFVDTIGESIGERGFCQHRGYTKYIWHTHSHNLLPYPSEQDIVNILKWHLNNKFDNYPVTSFVFTTLGIWEIHSAKKFQLDKNWLDYLHVIVKQSINKLYKNYDHTHVRTIINKIVQKINEKVFDIKLGFSPWSEGPYVVKYN